MTPVVRVADVGKRYVKFDDVPFLVSRAMRLWARGKRAEFWALRHVNLEVGAEETVGVIGRNGAGKSTMLRILAGVTAPTEGLVSVRGRVAPLLSVGVGFHPELTGRENVYVNGAVLGLARAELGRLFDQIVDFAEIGDFIDSPVKFYSSGMLVRLGFSVAIAARPDVLLVDEVLAVGDFAFQSKCFTRMAEMKSEGTCILVVSHNLNAVRRLCPRTLVLHGGEPRFLGDTHTAISVFHELLTSETIMEPGAETGRAAPVEILDLKLIGPKGETAHVDTGDEAAFRMRVRFLEPVEDGAFGLQIVTASGEQAFAQSNIGWGARPFRAGEEAECVVRFRTMLAGGSYIARGSVRWGGRPETQLGSAPMHFYVGGRAMVKGIVDLHAEFEVAAGSDLADPHPSSSPLDEASELSATGGVPIFGGSLSAARDDPTDHDVAAGTQGADAGDGEIRP